MQAQVQRGREEVKQIIRQAIRKEFPTDTIDVTDGYKENVHVMVVSRRFDDMPERAKHDLLWEIIDKGTDLSDEEKGLISLLYPISPSEIR